MELEIQHRPGGVRVIVQGPEGSAELRQVLDLLQSGADRLWLLDDRQQTVSVFPQDILYKRQGDSL